MTTAAMAAAAILSICVRIPCWLPGILNPGFPSPEIFSADNLPTAHWRIRDTFGNDFLNDKVQIRTTAGIIPSVCGRSSLPG
jgi:hypothetical protein